MSTHLKAPGPITAVDIIGLVSEGLRVRIRRLDTPMEVRFFTPRQYDRGVAFFESAQRRMEQDQMVLALRFAAHERKVTERTHRYRDALIVAGKLARRLRRNKR
jgi:hypothetical protein